MDDLISTRMSGKLGLPVYNGGKAGVGPLIPLVDTVRRLGPENKVLIHGFIQRDISKELFVTLYERLPILEYAGGPVEHTKNRKKQAVATLMDTSASARIGRLCRTYFRYYIFRDPHPEVVRGTRDELLFLTETL